MRDDTGRLSYVPAVQTPTAAELDAAIPLRGVSLVKMSPEDPAGSFDPVKVAAMLPTYGDNHKAGPTKRRKTITRQVRRSRRANR